MGFTGDWLYRTFYRRVNVRALAIVVILAALCGGGVYLLHGWQTRRHAVHFLQQARRAKEEGETQEAIDQFNRYLKLVPDDSEATAELGLLLADTAPGRRAYELLERVLRHEPQRTDVRRELAELAVRGGRYSDARDHLDRLLIAFPDDSELLELLATCQLRQDEDEEAARTLETAIENGRKNTPQRVRLYGYLAALLRDPNRLDQPDEAAAWMDRVVEENPDSAEAHVLRGNYVRLFGEIDDAADAAAKALSLEPDDQDALWLAARCALQRDRLDEARDHARRALDLDPKQPRTWIALADVELKAGAPEEAIRWLESGLEENPDQPDILHNLAGLLVESGRADKAQATIDTLRGIELPQPLGEPFQARVDYLQARVDYQRGHWRAAADRLDRARRALGGSPRMQRNAEYWLGRCYGRLAAPDLQLAAFRRAVALDRLWIPVRVEMVEALLASGQLDKAMTEQRKLMQLPGAPPGSPTQLARVLLLENLRHDPAERNWEEVERAIDAAAQADPEAVEVVLLRAEALVGQKRHADAEQLLEDAVAATPQEASLWLLLAALYRQQDQLERAEELLDEAAGKLDDGVALRLARAACLVDRNDDEAAAALRQLADNTDAFSEGEVVRLRRGLMRAHMRLGDLEEALRLGRQLVQKLPRDLPLRLVLFELALGTRNASAIDEGLKEIEAIEGQGPFWHYGQAARLELALATDPEKAKDREEALNHLAEAARLRPAWGRVPLLAGRIHDRAGDRQAALREYRQAIELGELHPTAVHRVIQSMYTSGRFEEADRLIRRLEKQQGTLLSGDLGRMASAFSMQVEDFDRALQTARRIAAGSTDYRDHLWLGQICGILGQRAKNEGQLDQSEELFTEAEEAFQKAVTLAGEVPQTWIALVGFLARTGKTDRAEEAIARAETKIPADRAPLAMAQAYELLGNLPEAASRYDAALATASHDATVVRRVAEFYLRTGRAAEAKEQLERIVSGQVEAQPSDLIPARRRLALLLAARPDPGQHTSALELIEENLRLPHPSILDQRAKAIILATDRDPRRRKEAIQTLETLLEEQPLASPEDRLLLARIYLAEKDWRKARKLLSGLAVSESRQPRYLVAHIEALLEHAETADARQWLARLEQVAPGQFPPAALRARLEFVEERADQGIEALKAYIENTEAQPPNRPQRLRLAATWLEQFARGLEGRDEEPLARKLKGEAEAMLRRHLATHPGEALLLVRFLGREGRLEEATTLASQAVENADPAAIAQICGVLLAGGAEPGERIQQIEEVLDAALEKHPQSIPLLMVMADVMTLQEQYDQVEAVYRKVIAKDDRHVPALNNLAVLLALRETKIDESLELIQKAIEVAGPDSVLLDSRATVFLAQRQPQKALADLEKAIAKVPRPTRYFHRAQAYDQLGQKKLAAESFEEARRRGLKAEHLHWLERAAYGKLRDELK